ncbi:hypothetical protein RHMOL_Rhmol08G0269600 [Rhododendron molle]|uniref:Uncharacterized protein n=1 Tax=Rhododendron molle TaxID=49168 RepID=A0ACC0MUF1_RHOML|nr:hypothetical protein RHMOL_Rhmol08G0269600 [Rhododendron molle]
MSSYLWPQPECQKTFDQRTSESLVPRKNDNRQQRSAKNYKRSPSGKLLLKEKLKSIAMPGGSRNLVKVLLQSVAGSKDSVGVDVAVLGHPCDRCVGFPEICNLGAKSRGFIMRFSVLPHEERYPHKEASRLLANLIVMGGGIMARAVVQAYRQALMNASKNGVAHEAAQNIIRATKIMAEPEARQILGVTERSSWEEILQKYDHLFEKNAKNGSFYLQSKVHRAKECLEMEYRRAAERATGS